MFEVTFTDVSTSFHVEVITRVKPRDLRNVTSVDTLVIGLIGQRSR